MLMFSSVISRTSYSFQKQLWGGVGDEVLRTPQGGFSIQSFSCFTVKWNVKRNKSNAIWEETLLQQYNINFAGSGSHMLKVSVQQHLVQQYSKWGEKNTLENILKVFHAKSRRLHEKKKFWIEKYTNTVISETPIGKGFKWMVLMAIKHW